MKTKLQLAALLCASTFIIHSSAFGQGALTPPVGAPAPVMKSLDQIEARTPISSVPFTIANSGSFYLTTNLTVASGNAISINASGVTLDLKGFTIKSSALPALGNAISISAGRFNVSIKDGFIEGGMTNNGTGTFSGPGFSYGIFGNVPQNVRIQNVSVIGCENGIYIGYGPGNTVESCLLKSIKDEGIRATIVNKCSMSDCGGAALVGRTVSDSYGFSVADTGITGDAVINCYGGSTTGIGINAKVANNCVGFRTSGTAINATVANGCYAASGTNLITYKYNMP